MTLDRKWRRLYPIRFRQLKERFNRWDWVSYNWRAPTSDTRKESRHVFEDTITVHPYMPTDERADFLEPLIVESVQKAASRGDSLALIRPAEVSFRYKPKPVARIEAERAAYRQVANQVGFFDRELAAIEPSPFEFRLSFRDADGWHHHSCHDWETAATYWKLGRKYDRDTALARLDGVYNQHYPKEGLVVALGNMARRPQTWLLLGVIRLDRPSGARLFP